MAPRGAKGGLVTAIYARSLLDYLRARGLDPAGLYSEGWIASLEAPGARTQVALADWIHMFEVATTATGDPDLALKAGASVKTRHLGALAQILMSCTDFAEMLGQLKRYIRLLGEIGEPRLEVRGSEAHMMWTWPYGGTPPAALAQFMQATRVTYARWLLNRQDFTVDAYFHFAPPAGLAIYEKLFGGRLHFDQSETKLVFPAGYLSAPIVSADENSRRRAEREAREVLQALSGEPPFVRELKVALSAGLAAGRVSLAQTARTLGLPGRTLQRRLSEQDSSFREVLDEVRKARACAYVQEPQRSLAEIAFLLGYTEQSTFQYAFKRWTGIAPGAFRRRALGAGGRRR